MIGGGVVVSSARICVEYKSCSCTFTLTRRPSARWLAMRRMDAQVPPTKILVIAFVLDQHMRHFPYLSPFKTIRRADVVLADIFVRAHWALRHRSILTTARCEPKRPQD